NGRCKACAKLKAKAWAADHPEKAAAGKRKARRKAIGFADPHGESKIGTCALCPFRGKLHSDHDHATGKTRGWLCQACNSRLGYLETNTSEWLERAERYRKSYES